MPPTATVIHPVIAIVGADRFLRNDVLARLLGELSEDGQPASPTRFDGAGAVLAAVLDEVRTPSLLGERRIVIVDDADPFIRASRAALERYGTAPAKHGTLILLCNTLPKNTRLYRIIQQTGRVIAVDVPKGRAVVRWAVERAKADYGKRLAAPAARALCERVGEGAGLIDAELSKLANYVGPRDEITPADIDALTGHHREEKVFAVTDAISSGDAATALQQWEQVLATDRAAPARAIAGLAWGLRRLLEARRAWERGTDIQQLARRFYTDPALLRRRLEAVTQEQLEGQQRDLLDADLAVKTGASTVGVAVEKFILKHAGARATAR